MAYKLVITPKFVKKAAKFLRRHPDMENVLEKTLSFLETDPFHPSLRLHQLSGKLDGLYSVSLNLSYRIVLEFLVDGDNIVPIDIGDHDAVY